MTPKPVVPRLLTAALLALAALAVPSTRANVRLPSLFTSHMVLQRDRPNPVWGWADPGEAIIATLAGQTYRTTADATSGRWQVKLDPLPAGGPHTLVIHGRNTVTLDDILVGEVWVCSGQSNMQWPVAASNDADLEIRTANFPRIRLLTVPQVGTQVPQDDFEGTWHVCTPETVRDFSAVGFFCGRLLHQTLDVPIGLIDNSWGGSAAEAWVRKEVLAGFDRYQPLLARWTEAEAKADEAAAMAEYENQLKAWNVANASAKAEGRPQPPRPKSPNTGLAGQGRPANLYNGVLHPILGCAIRGAIWYQGESNAGRAYQYRHLFPLMIQLWRDEWKQGDFPFYWVQLADFMDEKPDPTDSSWAELREAQTMTLTALPNTGEAVIIDIGEGRDIHPRNKQDVAKRLARWALAKDYGLALPYRSPTFKSQETKDGKIVLTFDYVGGGLYAFDVKDPVGFAIAGEDRKFVWAKAHIVAPDKVEVWNDAVTQPVAVRYAWADNPVCNLRSKEGLPATPFRTDDWPGVTANSR